MEERRYWYACDLRTALNRTKTVFGTVEAINEYKAMDALEKRVRKEHMSKIIRARLHEFDDETGKCEEPCFMMDNVLPDGGLHEKHRTEDDTTETSQACEEVKPATQGVSEPKFGDGWGKSVKDEVPVVGCRFK